MIVMTTATTNKELFFIPREYETTNLTVDLTDDITGDLINPDSETYTRQGDYLKAVVAYTGLKEDRFYTLRATKTSGDVVYKDKVFVTNQTIDQVNNEAYTINEDEYVEQATSNNDYIVL
tara:strand:- start:2833 stop:3192 length:360 start_codon:yes stop_codon:yes gene_type:complete